MIDKTLTAPEGVKYLGDWMKEIPANCVLNKGVTGCGATTLAIKQNRSTIIAVPFVGLVKNKMEQNPELLGIYGEGDKTEEIREYVNSHPIIKVAVTYDSLNKVTTALSELDLSPYQGFHLVIDEYHLLLNSYSFRSNAIHSLLEEAKRFKDVTYISATPLEKDLWPEALKHLPEYRIEWPDTKQVSIRSYKVNRPLDYMARWCAHRMKTGSDSNYHIFLNSVKDICKIIKKAGLTPDDVRIVCSPSNRKENLPEGFSISSTTDPVKTINFYTSTCFEGQDIYDENGRTFIVSEACRQHTMIDISTTFLQICGRIRDSKYSFEITHLYSTSIYKDIGSEEEFNKMIKKHIEDAKESAEWLRDAPGYLNTNDIVQALKEPYIQVIDGKIRVDRDMANYDIMNYRIVHGIYKTQFRVNEEYRKNGLQVIERRDITQEEIKLITEKKEDFKSLFIKYADLRDSTPFYSFTKPFQLECMEMQNPLLRQAYDILGREEVERLNYHQSNIKRKIIAGKDKTTDWKIANLLKSRLHMNEPIPVKDIKAALQQVYSEVNLRRTAKATDIVQWFESTDCTVKKSGRSVAAKILKMCLIREV